MPAMPAKMSGGKKKSVRINLTVSDDDAYRLRLLAAIDGCKDVNDYVAKLVDKVLADNAARIDALLTANLIF